MVENLNPETPSQISSRFGWANRIKKNLIPVAIVIAGLLVAGTIYYLNYKNQGNKIVGLLTPQQAADKAINYINENLLASGTVAVLLNVSDQNGIYKFQLKIANQQYDSYVTKDGQILFTQAISIGEEASTTQNSTQKTGSTIGDFSVSNDQICQENGKPLVYFFGSESCPHCRWEKPIFENVAKNFEGYISFHENIDSQNDTDLFSKYSTGGIPTLVLGCKYYRVGSGEQAGEQSETKNLTALFCKLTGEKPDAVCGPVKDLVNQIQ